MSPAYPHLHYRKGSENAEPQGIFRGKALLGGSTWLYVQGKLGGETWMIAGMAYFLTRKPVMPPNP